MIDGRAVIANTRTSTALTDAGIPINQWYGVDRTGQVKYPGVTYDMDVNNQLIQNAASPILQSNW